MGLRFIIELGNTALVGGGLLLWAAFARGDEPTQPPPRPLMNPSVDMKLHIELDPVRNEGTVRGEIETVLPEAPGAANSEDMCFLLPYMNPEYEFDPMRNFDLLPRKYTKIERSRGRIDTNTPEADARLEYLTPYLVRVHSSKEHRVRLAFTTQLPRWPDADPDEWMLHDFYPQVLQRCPDEASREKVDTYLHPQNIDLRASVATDESWQILSAADSNQGAPPYSLNFYGSQLSFILGRGFQLKPMQHGDLNVLVAYKNPNFLNLIPTFEHALDSHTLYFGPFPYRKVVLAETSELERGAIPGMVTINRPRQAGLNDLQQDVLNWTHWQLTSFVAEQWCGTALHVHSWDDLWLLRGFVEFATYEALHSLPAHFNFFASSKAEQKQDEAQGGSVSFDYRQAQDLLAAIVTYMHPFNALTTPDFVSSESFDNQHSLGYVRHALALRQLNWLVGRKQFQFVVSKFVRTHIHDYVHPAQFAQHLANFAYADRVGAKTNLQTMLQQWWSTKEWPEFALADIDEKELGNGHFRVRVGIKQADDFHLPVEANIIDENGREYRALTVIDADADSGRWYVDVETDAPWDRIELDHDHEVFDWDRFNARTGGPKVSFLPGGASTFGDDAYTVLWLPLAAQLPGQPFTWYVATQTFKYIHSTLTGTFAYVPSEDRVGYQFYYLKDLPSLGSYIIADAIQDYGETYRGERVVDVGLYRTMAHPRDPIIEYGVRLRDRTFLNQPDTDHQTAAFTVTVVPLNQYGECNYSGKTQLEHTLPTQQLFSYDRDWGEADGTCKVVGDLELGGRVFSGSVTQTGDIPEGIYFNPQDVNEARLRFDGEQLDSVRRITTIGSDMLFPSHVPFPDFMFAINRQSRWRLFYDWGRSEQPDDTYRSAGGGIFVPFGGDLVGKGSLTIVNFSALVVMYREHEGYKSTAPGFLFDFDFFGKL